ncbi:hypothetical protein BT69DRAFT_1330479 [Atractiella rhizophila]|nr:hypothetical protein BT69DRAFT_1330479 [Atractiella rhizophila]
MSFSELLKPLEWRIVDVEEYIFHGTQGGLPFPPPSPASDSSQYTLTDGNDAEAASNIKTLQKQKPSIRDSVSLARIKSVASSRSTTHMYPQDLVRQAESLYERVEKTEWEKNESRPEELMREVHELSALLRKHENSQSSEKEEETALSKRRKNKKETPTTAEKSDPTPLKRWSDIKFSPEDRFALEFACILLTGIPQEATAYDIIDLVTLGPEVFANRGEETVGEKDYWRRRFLGNDGTHIPTTMTRPDVDEYGSGKLPPKAEACWFNPLENRRAVLVAYTDVRRRGLAKKHFRGRFFFSTRYLDMNKLQVQYKSSREEVLYETRGRFCFKFNSDGLWDYENPRMPL